MKITVIGLGYVGLSHAVLLSQYHQVIGVDLEENKINAINKRISPINDKEIQDFLQNRKLDLTASTDLLTSIVSADFIVISTPTNYNVETNYFDTASVERLCAIAVENNPQACVVVKSTIPVGFIDKVRTQLQTDNIIFSPEFLREGKALHDNLFPSRIIVGDDSEKACLYAELLRQSAQKKDIDIIYMGTREAEAVKLFSNTYLAMRVAFFNELDSYSLSHKLSAKDIIDGVCLDPRIGNGYNNPSFGYGGYCLPKDTKQLAANFEKIPQTLIDAIISSNDMRQTFLLSEIEKYEQKTIGIYRLSMKEGSDNFRESSIITLATELEARGYNIIVYEPDLTESNFLGFKIATNYQTFMSEVGLVIANRQDEQLKNSKIPVFSRDIYGVD